MVSYTVRMREGVGPWNREVKGLWEESQAIEVAESWMDDALRTEAQQSPYVGVFRVVRSVQERRVVEREYFVYGVAIVDGDIHEMG